MLTAKKEMKKKGKKLTANHLSYTPTYKRSESENFVHEYESYKFF